MDNKFFLKVPSVRISLGRLEFVLEKCKEKKVLHLGCVDEVMLSKKIKDKTQLTHIMLSKIAREVWGMDISVKGIELLKEMGIEHIFQGNIENIDKIKELKGQNFDIILATEILEHLDNPGLFLKGARSLFSTDTEMIITVPNALQLTAFEYSLRGIECSHPAHNFWFSYKTLRNLLDKYNYEIVETLAYSNVDWRSSILAGIGRKIKSNLGRVISQRKEAKHKEMLNEIKHSPSKINRTLKEVIGILARRLLFKLNPFFADGIIFVVKTRKFA